jgi:hypothetical protein
MYNSQTRVCLSNPTSPTWHVAEKIGYINNVPLEQATSEKLLIFSYLKYLAQG